MRIPPIPHLDLGEAQIKGLSHLHDDHLVATTAGLAAQRLCPRTEGSGAARRSPSLKGRA